MNTRKLVLAGFALPLFVVSASAQTTLHTLRDSKGNTITGTSHRFRSVEETAALNDLQQSLGEIRNSLRKEQVEASGRRIDEYLNNYEKRMYEAVDRFTARIAAETGSSEAPKKEAKSDGRDLTYENTLKFFEKRIKEKFDRCQDIAKRFPSLEEAQKDDEYRKNWEEGYALDKLRNEWSKTVLATYGVGSKSE